MENYFTESGESYFFHHSASLFILQNYFSLKICFLELLLDSIENQLYGYAKQGLMCSAQSLFLPRLHVSAKSEGTMVISLKEVAYLNF